MEKLKCTQCGATEMTDLGDDKFKCAYCGTQYLRHRHAGGPRVIIGKNANVVFGKNAHVEIHGGLEIEGGAHVQIDGELKIIEVGDEELIRAARQKP